MNNFKIIAFAIAAFALSNSAFSQNKEHGGSPNQASQSHGGMAGMHGSANASKVPFDQQFLDTMAMHHEHGIKMAELVELRSSSDALKDLAKKMIDDQQREIKQMQDMKQKWYAGKDDAMNMQMPGMKESMLGMEAKMQKLEASQGDAFDAMFVDMMSKHHQNAMKMSRSALSRAQHQEVKQMAKRMRDEQQKDISKMTALMKGANSAGQ